MTIYELSDMVNEHLILTRYSNQGTRWSAQINHAETKEFKGSAILCGEYGDGNSPETAIADYVQRIRGKVLVIDSMGKDRREFVVPATLTD